MRWLCALVLLCLATAGWAQLPVPERVQVPPKQGYLQNGLSPNADGWWYLATGGQKAPAVVLLHGCGGMLNKQGLPSAKTREYAEMLTARGWHVLALDSFTGRGEKEICTQRHGTRKVTIYHRHLEALGALEWLARQPQVDATRLALLGWSNGGSTVLAATHHGDPDVLHAKVHPRFAAAFYPGCETAKKRGYEPVADTLLLVGLADDWTPAAPCLGLARTGTPGVKVLAYEGAYHGFDGTAPVRLRTDVPNGVNPGQGVHVGGQPQARAASQQALLEALDMAFAPTH